MSEIILLNRKEVSVTDIKNVEKKLDLELPKDFKTWILNFGIGYPKPDCFKIGNDIDVFNNFIDLNEEEGDNIYEVIEDLEDRLPNYLLPFGEDPFGNFLCFDYSNNQSVVFWDHEIWDLDRQKISFVAETFTEFLEMLFPAPEDDE